MRQGGSVGVSTSVQFEKFPSEFSTGKNTVSFKKLCAVLFLLWLLGSLKPNLLLSNSSGVGRGYGSRIALSLSLCYVYFHFNIKH